jgi:hypothetical protein
MERLKKYARRKGIKRMGILTKIESATHTN